MGGTLTDLRSTLLDICRLTGSTPWQVFRQVLQIPRVPGPKYHWRPNAELLAPAVIDHFKEEQLTHPWLEGPVDSLPGKAAHIAMIIRAQGYMEAQDRRFPFDPVHPLMSQPIRSEEHTSELQSLMRISYAVFCLKTKNKTLNTSKHNN